MLRTSVGLLVFVVVSLVLWSLLESGGGYTNSGVEELFENLKRENDRFPYRARLTQNLLCEACPVFVQDGESIVYVAEMEMELEDDGLFTKREALSSQVFVVKLETGERRRLSHGRWFEQYPRPSWSGDRLIFQAKRQSTSPSTELHSVDISSGRRFDLAGDGIPGTAPAFAPGDSLCVFVSRGEGICVLDLFTGERKSIYYRPGLFRWRRLPPLPDMPSFSPDGKRILFESGLSRKRIFTMDRDGHDLKLLTPPGENCFHPVFSPSGKEVLFVSDYDGSHNLFLLSLADMALVQITSDSTDKAYPSFSPEGTKIAFASKPKGSEDHYYDIFIISREPLSLPPAMEDEESFKGETLNPES